MAHIGRVKKADRISYAPMSTFSQDSNQFPIDTKGRSGPGSTKASNHWPSGVISKSGQDFVRTT